MHKYNAQIQLNECVNVNLSQSIEILHHAKSRNQNSFEYKNIQMSFM